MTNDTDKDKRFSYLSPSVDGASRHRALTDAFEILAGRIEAICPLGRERSLAMTNLEQSKMWSSAAVARNPDTR